MQALHPRFGPWILGRQKTQNTNFASKFWALDFERQKTQNTNFACKVWDLDFRQAEDPDCKLCIQGLGIEFLGRQKAPECKLCIQGLGIEF